MRRRTVATAAFAAFVAVSSIVVGTRADERESGRTTSAESSLIEKVQRLRQGPLGFRAAPMPPLTEAGGMGSDRHSRVRRVSDPAADYRLARLGGFTQNETSTAWCGPNVVVGFRDTGSILETAFSNEHGISSNGIAVSHDGGRSFHDLGFLPPGPPELYTDGNSNVVCGSDDVFYYSAYALQVGGRYPDVQFTVSTSLDGGRTWSTPHVAVSRSNEDFALFDSSLAVDPADPRRLYLAYTSIQRSGPGDTCPQGVRATIEAVRSGDAGFTWSAPTVVEDRCSDGALAAQIEVGPAGEVYVASTLLSEDLFTRFISVRRSVDGGATFGPGVPVVRYVQAGTGRGFLQGNFWSGRAFALAVDRSARRTRGSVYLAWTEGRDAGVADPIADTGFYGFADIQLVRSVDGGATWSDPVLVHEPDAKGAPTDQFQPTMAVDAAGRVGVCFHDRRFDPRNVLVDRTCALSSDGGRRWMPERITPQGALMVHTQDQLVPRRDIGSYDTLAADGTGRARGFIGAFAVPDNRGNPDVKAARVFGLAD